MAAVESFAGDTGSLGAPGGEDVVEMADGPLRSPECEQGCLDFMSGGLVGCVEFETDAGGGAIVFTTCVDSSGVAEAAEVLAECGGCGGWCHVLAEVGFGVEADHAFGAGSGLDEEEPPDVAGGEVLVGFAIHGEGGGDVEDGEPGDGFGVIERHAMRDATSAIMAGDGEVREPEMAHDLHLIGCHGAGGVVDVLRAAVGLGGVAVAAEIGEHDGEVLSELRRDLVPRDMGFGVAVEQEERRAAAADERVDDCAFDGNHGLLEAREKLACDCG